MNRKKIQVLSIPYVIWIIGFTVIPLLFVFAKAVTSPQGAFTAGNLIAIFDPVHRKALFLSIELAFISSILCILISYPVALILRSSKIRNKKIILFVMILPMWMNFILRILAIQMLISKNGLINHFLSLLGLGKISIINTEAAIIIGMVYDYLPYMLLPVLNCVLAIPDDIIEASKDLGANRFTVLTKILIPLSLSGIGSGITMVFVPSMTEFVIANILGGGKIMLLGNVIEQEFSVTMNWNLGSGLSVTLMIFVLLTTLISGRTVSETDKGFVI
ncbi:MAG: ABC transporter permease [Lachnospiraceae bacterium]|nr:ABC transporter permease [Lachnospiraceae bacterium]